MLFPDEWQNIFLKSGNKFRFVQSPIHVRNSRVLAQNLCFATQSKYRDLRPGIETHPQQVTNATTDVHSAVPCQTEFTSRVTAVSYWQLRRRKKRRFALPSMGVARKNPAFITSPNGFVRRIRIVAEHDGWFGLRS